MVHDTYAVWDQIVGKWKEIRGKVRKQWGKLTDDDLEQIQGDREILIGKLQQRYGMAREEALRHIDVCVQSLKF